MSKSGRSLEGFRSLTSDPVVLSRIETGGPLFDEIYYNCFCGLPSEETENPVSPNVPDDPEILIPSPAPSHCLPCPRRPSEGIQDSESFTKSVKSGKAGKSKGKSGSGKNGNGGKRRSLQVSQEGCPPCEEIPPHCLPCPRRPSEEMQDSESSGKSKGKSGSGKNGKGGKRRSLQVSQEGCPPCEEIP